MAKKYIHRPTEAEAIQFTGDNEDEVLSFAQEHDGCYKKEGIYHFNNGEIILIPMGEFSLFSPTLRIEKGDFVIWAPKECTGGYLDVICEDHFHAMYEEAL